MTDDLEKAAAIVDDGISRFDEKINELLRVDERFVNAAKKASGSVRDATQKLADGLARIEKTANFDRLERMTDLLERAERALTSLAELDKTGKLERIAAALK